MAAFLALGACKPEVGPIGPSYEAGAGILGTWELTMVEQTDVTLPVPETRDVSDLYLDAQNKWVVAFNSDSTYSVNQQGPDFDVFGPGGTWRSNTPASPSEVHLTQGSTVVVFPGLLYTSAAADCALRVDSRCRRRRTQKKMPEYRSRWTYY